MGRALYRASLERDLGIEVVAFNDIGAPETMAGLLARDSVYGRLRHDIKVADDAIIVDGSPIRFCREKDPAALPWKELGVDVAVEATGRFRTRESAVGASGRRRLPRRRLGALQGRRRHHRPRRQREVLRSQPAHQVVSNASCTTNCLAPMIKVLDDNFGVEQGFITTVHAYTGDQLLVDGPHKDARRARAAAINIVPTSTGAARATGLVLPSVEGRLDGSALRVPVPDGSITDLVAMVAPPGDGRTRSTTPSARRPPGRLAGILEYSDEPLVSADIVGSAASCVFDSGLTMAAGQLVKVYGWYDNEWGYANRLGELAAYVGR